MTCAALQPLHTFSWLLEPAQFKQLSAWNKKAIGPSDLSKAGVVAQSADGKKKKKSGKTASSVTSLVKGLFT